MENLKEVVENLVHLNMIMKADCPIKIENPKAHDWLVNFLVEFAEKQVKNCTIPDVMLSLPTVEEIEAWAKEHSKIEPTGAEEFGRCWGAIWMRELIIEKLKGNGA